MRKAATQTFKVSVHKDGMEWGEYVRAGDSYDVTHSGNPRADYYFRNVATGGGTMMRPYQFARAVKAGWMTVQA